MPRIMQLVGEDFDVIQAYVGVEREVRVDTSNQDLIVFDGSTPGGHRLMNQANADQRYQRANGEIDGITGFAPTDKGILVRRGEGEYVLRTLLVNPNNEISLANGDGFDGNPTLQLADTFVNEKTFAADTTFQMSIVGEAGGGVAVDWEVGGDLSVGGGVAITGGATIGGTLVPNVLNMTGKTLTLADNQIPINKISTDLNLMFNMFKNCVFTYTGSVASIPAGFALCNGATVNGVVTKNLLDRMLLCAGSGYAVGGTGGLATQNIGNVNGTAISIAQMPAHAHGVTDPTHGHGVTDPQHTHGVTWGGNNQYLSNLGAGSGVAGLAAGNSVLAIAYPGSTNAASTGVTVNAGGTGVSINNNGGGGTHDHTTNNFDNRPPYYALAFIQWVGV